MAILRAVTSNVLVHLVINMRCCLPYCFISLENIGVLSGMEYPPVAVSTFVTLPNVFFLWNELLQTPFIVCFSRFVHLAGPDDHHCSIHLKLINEKIHLGCVNNCILWTQRKMAHSFKPFSRDLSFCFFICRKARLIFSLFS